MSPDWRPVCRAPAGGTVLNIAAAPGEIWLASPAGLFHREGAEWHLSARSSPMTQPSAVFVSGKTILVSGSNGGIYRSIDRSLNWEICRTEQTRAQVLCFAASPNFTRDGVILAGTAGDGILRSRDGGRTWQLSNFGLRDFNILSLLTGSEWGRREPVYAGTENGLYISPNAGRAWKAAALEQGVVLSLARWWRKDDRESLFAGLEEGGLCRSDDGGTSWDEVDLGDASDLTVNAILCGEHCLLIGTSEAGLIRSVDGGCSWSRSDRAPGMVMCLTRQGERLWLGAAGAGLWFSDDSGESWSQDESLSARRFHALANLRVQAEVNPIPFMALSVDGGIWESQPGQLVWSPLNGWPDDRPVFDLIEAGHTLLAGADDGIWEADLKKSAWHKVLDEPEGVTMLRPGESRIWAGSSLGGLWLFDDQSGSWVPIETPFRGSPFSELFETADETGQPVLYAACHDQQPGQSRLFQLKVITPRPAGSGWELCLSERASSSKLFLARGGAGGNQILVCDGEACLWRSSAGWVRGPLSDLQKPVSALAWDPCKGNWVIAGGGRIWHSIDRREWVEDPGWTSPDLISAIRCSVDGRLFALARNGVLWMRA